MEHIKHLTFAAAMAALTCVPATAQRNDSIAEERALTGVTIMENARRTPVSATAPLRILDDRYMLRLGMADMADALRRLPGITLRDYGGAGGMKTVAVRGLGAQHTGVSYDGVALSDCQTGEIDVSRYSLENAESIALTISDNEDIFVPARNAAFASMLSVNTVQPPSGDLLPHVTAQVKLGSFGYVSPFVRYSHNFTDRLAFTMSGEYVYADNDYPFTLRNGGTTMREKRTNSRMNSAHAEAGFIWQTGTNSRLDGKIYYYDNNRRLPGQVRYYTDMSGERLHESNVFAQAQCRVWNSRNLSAKFTAKYNWASSIYTDATYKDGANDASYW
ncbi:MAG TPA: Plug domain-containing protein, partial [Candidatus Prevotella stercoripullorum]|nr:Plug domain-containing protein [Candidatus Prevotella stercoripullorum]